MSSQCKYQSATIISSADLNRIDLIGERRLATGNTFSMAAPARLTNSERVHGLFPCKSTDDIPSVPSDVT